MSATGLVLATSLALLTTGCIPQDWTVFAISNASVDVIVRVTFDGGSRDVLVKARQDEVVVSLDYPRPPATVSLLDPKTCAVIASSELPTAFPVAIFDNETTPGKFLLSAVSRDVGAKGGTSGSPADARCAGR